MTHTTLGCKGRNCGLFYGLAGLAVAAATWAGPAWSLDCAAPGLGAHTGLTRSQWDETSAQGRLLVRERGTLKSAGLTADGACERWQWRLALTRSTGARAYDGVTSTNFPLQTSSGISITDASAQVWTPPIAQWSGGLRVNHRQLDRDIAGVGLVRGYPERFTYWQAAAGLRHEVALGDGLVLTGEGWIGGGPAGNHGAAPTQRGPGSAHAGHQPAGRNRFANRQRSASFGRCGLVVARAGGLPVAGHGGRPGDDAVSQRRAGGRRCTAGHPATGARPGRSGSLPLLTLRAGVLGRRKTACARRTSGHQ